MFSVFTHCMHRTTGGFRGPFRFPVYTGKSQGEHEHCTKMCSIAHFPEQITNRTVHLRPNRFIFERIMLYCHVTAQCNNCYISFHLASRFNTEIYKNSSFWGPESLSVLRPWTPLIRNSPDP